MNGVPGCVPQVTKSETQEVEEYGISSLGRKGGEARLLQGEVKLWCSLMGGFSRSTEVPMS